MRLSIISMCLLIICFAEIVHSGPSLVFNWVPCLFTIETIIYWIQVPFRPKICKYLFPILQVRPAPNATAHPSFSSTALAAPPETLLLVSVGFCLLQINYLFFIHVPWLPLSHSHCLLVFFYTFSISDFSLLVSNLQIP